MLQLASPLSPLGPSPPSVQTLKVLEAMPPLEELAKYNAAGQDGEGGGGGGDLSSLMASLPADSSLPKAKFNKGDKVGGGEDNMGGRVGGQHLGRGTKVVGRGEAARGAACHCVKVRLCAGSSAQLQLAACLFLRYLLRSPALPL